VIAIESRLLDGQLSNRVWISGGRGFRFRAALKPTLPAMQGYGDLFALG
jgi:hypothetical protein